MVMVKWLWTSWLLAVCAATWFKDGIVGVQSAMTRGTHVTVHIYSVILRLKQTF